MADIKWIKITTDIFDDEKILLIENLPDGDALIVIWFKLLCLAGKQNNGGVFMLNDRLAITEDMLATIFRRSKATVRLALETFEQFGMIETLDGVITIPNWEKHQNIDGMEKIREQNRIRKQNQREREKLLSCDSHVTVTPSHATDKDKDKDKDKNKNSVEEDVQAPQPTVSDYDGIIRLWNSCQCTQNIDRISPATRRDNNTRILLHEYGLGPFLDAIRSIDEQEFFQMNAKKRSLVTYDWFTDRNNYQKVIEGNYRYEHREETFLERLEKM